MATNDNAETNNPVDVLLTEEDVLEFFHSRSDEVRNSELIAHFRPALKISQHRDTNRKQFLHIMNRLATARVDADGGKILTLKKKFRRSDDDVDTSKNNNAGEVVVEDSAAATETTHKTLPTDNEEHRDQNILQGIDTKITDTKQDNVSGAQRNRNDKEEQSRVDDTEPTEFHNDDKTFEASANDDQITAQHDHESTSIEEAKLATKKTVTETNVRDGGDEVPVSSTPKTKRRRRNKPSLESKLSDTSNAGEFHHDERTTETTTYDHSDVQQRDHASTSVEELKTERETGDIDLGDQNLEPSQRSRMNETREKSSVEIVVEDHSSEGQTADEVDGKDILRVRELAQRIDDAASQQPIVARRVNKQGRSQPVRPPSDRRRQTTTSTPYDFTMTEAQREWTLQASYSDYQALSKLLSRCPGLASRRDFITGYSALHWAAKNGQVEVVKLLMGSSEAPDVDARSHGGYTALHVAAMNSRHAVIELLAVVYKADPDITDFSGRKPVHYLSQDAVAGKRSSAFFRSEMLLTPKRGATTRRKSLVGRRRPTVTADDDDDSDRSSTIQSLISLTQSATMSLMLPPRDLPAAVKRRPVSMTRQDSHSDSETSGVQLRRGPIRPSGSTSDIGTIV